MNNPLLVDTSVWIDFFNGTENDNVKIFTEYLENDFPIYTCPIIIQEILQGIKKDKEYRQVKDYLFALNRDFYGVIAPSKSYNDNFWFNHITFTQTYI